ncbi:hypothetical protein BA6E_102289 [Bacteroidales bacterium 6E]|nr:hypothetical protein BA6E_102289 [Bacteroidales bacterium 6E]
MGRIQDNREEAEGCLVFVFLIFLIAVPFYIYYFYIFDLKERIESIFKEKPGFWSSVFGSFFILGESLDKDHDDYYELKKLKRLTLIAVLLTIISVYLLAAFLGKYT